MPKPFTFDRVVRIVIALSITAATFWFIDVLKNVLLPFCLACLISYIMEPFVEFNMRLLRQKGRVLAVIVTLFDVTLILGILVYFFTPLVAGEFTEMINMIKQNANRTVEIPFMPETITHTIESKFNLQRLIDEIEAGEAGWLDKGETLLTSTLEFLMHSLEWLLTFVYIVFVLIDYDKLGEGFRLLVPDKYKPIVFQIGNDIKRSMNLYFRSQLLIATCAAIFYSIGFTIVGLPMAIIMGVIVGILYMIPYFQYITLIPVALICYISSLNGVDSFWSLLGQCGLVYLVSQSICDYILTPKIMGNVLGLNPAIILLSLSIWGTLLGIIGMIIALPLTTLLLAYYKQVVIEHIPLGTSSSSFHLKAKHDHHKE